MKYLFALILLCIPIFGQANYFDDQKSRLNNSPGVWRVWDIVDNSRYCYRRINVIYKDNKVITGTPLLPIIANDNSEELREAINIIRRECF